MEFFFDLIEIIFKSLLRQKLRALAALMTVAVAVSGIILIAGRSLHAQKGTRLALFVMLDMGLLTVRPPSAVEQPGVTQALRSHLDLSDAAKLRELEGVEDAIPYIRTKAQLKYGRDLFEADVVGMPPAQIDAFGLRLKEGRFPQTNAKVEECLLGKNAAQYFFPNGGAPGKKLRLGGRLVHVVGVSDWHKELSSDYCIIDLDLAQTITHTEHPTAIAARLPLKGYIDQDLLHIRQTRSRITALLADTFGQTIAPHMVSSPADKMDTSMRGIKKLLASEALLLGLGLLIAIATVTELLYVDVRSNYREIGILRALGASKRQVTAEIILRSLLICLLGGLLGIALANSYYFWPESLQKQIRWESFPQLTYIALFLSIFSGLVASLLPALNAVSLPPVTAMREAAK